MRFPRLSELDNDQAAIYEGAPREGTILVIGPPGTGKTVVAFHRAGYLKRLGQSPQVAMYGSVLAKYTSHREGVARDVDVSTVHRWVGRWWCSITGETRPPTVSGDLWSFDWTKIQERVLSLIAAEKRTQRINWGHLLIDEGQDFPESMYVALHTIMLFLNAGELKPSAAITVLADDNQRLEAVKNSTVDQIRKALGLHESKRNVFVLKKNYRNTLEIARFAANFYMGLMSGIPELPEKRRGGVPVICVSDKPTEGQNLNSFVERIARYAIARGTEEVGVLVPNNAIRKSIVNRLRVRLDPKGIKLQTYARDDDAAKADDLVFDTPGQVTVLNFRSAKGLEFDSVFVVDPGRLASGSVDALFAKMTLYVMCSRARTSLNIMLVKDKSYDTILSWLPSAEGSYKLEQL
jgi:DNA helicase-2/ATP-dependent DNA helicase PcrA